MLAIGTYVIWPSRWNIPAHLQLGFCLIAYFIPVWVDHVTRHYAPALVRLDAVVLSLGAAAYLLGLIVGHALPVTNVLPAPLSWQFLEGPVFDRFLYRRATRLLCGAVAGLVGCFYIMGFVPLFAADRFDAKYFKGAYAALFHPVAIPYRLCFDIVMVLVPAGLMLWYVTRRWWPAALAGAGVLLMAVAMTRGPAVAGILIFLGLVAAERGRAWIVGYLLLVALLFPVGAAIYRVLGFHAYFHQNLWHVIAASTPDVAQQIQLLGAFAAHGQFTHGRTFFAGLLSGSNPWNPALYTLRLLNEGVNLNVVASGGLRLLVPQWGYTAFGWPGVAVVSFLSGLIMGNATRWAKLFVQGGNLLTAMVAMLLYVNFGGFLAGFYAMNKDGLVESTAVIALAYAIALAREDEDGRWRWAQRRRGAEKQRWSLTHG